MYEINIWSVIVASIVSFAIGAVWYSQMLFGKTWMSLLNIDEESIAEDRERGMWKKYIIHFIFTIISFGILAFIISMTGPMSILDGAFLGFILWIGFVASNAASDLLWRKTPLKVVLIDNLNILVGLIVGGAIIAAW